jgi:hypothetical protein
MASTDLITYLNYIATWDGESDGNIDPIISEHNQFVNIGDFDSDGPVNNEFSTLSGLAMEVRNLTISADAIQIAADAAAIASIWSFGLGMAAFAALEATVIIERRVISSKSSALNTKLTTADTDISAAIGDQVKNYVTIYKSNNNLIASKSPVGLDTRTCRSMLLQFMAQVERNTTLTSANFRKYAESARLVFNSQEIQAVYDALDTLNLSNRTDADVQKFMNSLAGFTFGGKEAIGLVTNFCVAIMFYKLRIANATIRNAAREAEIPIEEVDATVFETLDAVGKIVAVVTVIMSVVDMVFEILDIVDVVEQCNKMCDELNGSIKQSYLDYFNGIKTASAAYKAAIGGGSTPVPTPTPTPTPTPVPTPSPPATGNSASRDIDQMHAQIARWGSITQFGVQISTISGNADNPAQSSGIASKTDRGFGGYNGTWEIGNWGDTLRFT